MKNMLVIFFALTGLSLQGLAAELPTCTPTMTVEQAKAELKKGIAEADKKLQANYAVAYSQCDQAQLTAKAQYDQRATEIEATYAAQVQEIKANLDLGWRERLEMATMVHNEAVQNNSAQYSAQTAGILENYNTNVAQAKAAFQVQAETLTANYNKAVCAVPAEH